jgi:alpha-tubulin suppressor-like RCC1 family protein
MSQRETSPKLVVLNAIVLSISAGANHSCIIANMAPPNMFTFGMNANGQLGHDDQVDRCEPIAISHLDDRLIVSAGCGLAHTVACSNHGDVLVWGNGRSGQLGTYDGLDNDVSLPVQLPPFCTDSVVKVFCGDELTLVVTENKRVYMWGTESATGLGATHARDPTNPTGPKEVEGLHDVDFLAAGATHVIALVSHTTADNYDDEAFGYDD